jgi:hypothetical protein
MRFLAAIALLVSSSAFACPNLAGTYAACRSTTGQTPGSTNMVVTQSVSNKITTYEVSATNNETNERENETYIADGKINTQVITDPDSGMTLETSSKISCTPSTLSIDMNLKLNGEAAGYANIQVVKVGSQLIVDSTTFDGEQTIVEKEICE